METFRALVPYIAAALAIGVGLASVTAPPIFTLDRDLAVALIVGGFGGAGVSVVVPNVTRQARAAGEIEGRRAAASRSVPPRQ